MAKKEFKLDNGWDVDTYFSDDKIIWLLKNEYDVEVTRATDGKLVLSGDATKLTHAMKVVSNVVGRMKNGEVIDIKKFNCLISLEQDGALELEPLLNKICIGKAKNKQHKLTSITPMTLGQFELVTHLLSGNVETVLTTGEAGSGKTYLTVCVAALLTGIVSFEAEEQKELTKAVKAAIEKANDLGCLPESMRRYVVGNSFRLASQLDNIVVLRPIVATQDIGFLPGTAEEKVEPYLKQVFAYLNEIPDEYKSKKFNNMISNARAFIKDKESMPTDLVGLAKSAGLIRVELVELARGSNFRNAFVMGDELENVPTPIFEMLLDRAEDNCKIAFSGDIRQCDLKPGVISGLALYTDMYKHASPEELWCAAVVDLPDVLRSVRTKANHKLLAKYLEAHPEIGEQFKKGAYSHGVMPTINKTR